MNIWDIIDRAYNGLRMSEKEFDLQIFNKITELIKKYNIKYDGKSYIPIEDDTVDNVFKAAVDLLVDVGCYCIGINRVLKFSKDEIMEALRDAPREVTVGEGNDARKIYHRDIEDQNMPTFYGGTWAPFYEGDATVKIAQSIAQLPFVDMLGAGNLLSIEGRKIMCGAQEAHASRYVLLWYREGAKRAHRPGLAVVYYPISTNPATMISALFELRKSDVMITSTIPELRIEVNMLTTVAASLDHGCMRIGNSSSVLHGFAGGPEGTSIAGVATCIILLLAYKTHMVYWHITPFSSANWWSPEGQWTDAMPIQALARNSHVIISGTTGSTEAQPCTKMGFFEIAARVLMHVPSGSSFILAYRPFRVPRENLVTPLEIAFAHEVMLTSMKYKREDAMKVAMQCISKFYDMIKKPPEGASFLEAYDLTTLKPKKEVLEVYEEVKKELRDIGLEI